MKMKTEHYNHIKIAMKQTLETLKNNNINNIHEYIQYYIDNKVGKDYVKRATWDLFNNSIIDNKKSCYYCNEILYTYLDDTHITTALNGIIKQL